MFLEWAWRGGAPVVGSNVPGGAALKVGRGGVAGRKADVIGAALEVALNKGGETGGEYRQRGGDCEASSINRRVIMMAMASWNFISARC